MADVEVYVDELLSNGIRAIAQMKGAQAKMGERLSFLHGDHLAERFIIPTADGEGAKVVEYEKRYAPQPLTIDFRSANGFIDFMNNEGATHPERIVFVGETQAIAHLDWQSGDEDSTTIPYDETVRRSARLSLEMSEEYVSLLGLGTPHGQRIFWRVLLTELPTQIPEALALQAMSIKVKKQAENDYTIAEVGTASSKDAPPKGFARLPREARCRCRARRWCGCRSRCCGTRTRRFVRRPR